jgi:hypothetical protein
MADKEPIEHVLRPHLPWRDEADLTECGLDAARTVAIERPAFLAKLKQLGDRRTAMLTCMTCFETSRRWLDWDNDPRQALLREIQHEGHGPHARGNQLRDELRALAVLASEHQEEFYILLERELWKGRVKESTDAQP